VVENVAAMSSPPLKIPLYALNLIPYPKGGDAMAEVFVAGVGMTAFGKRSESLPELMAEAARMAIERSGRETFGALYVGVMNPEEFSGQSNIATVIADHLGMWASLRYASRPPLPPVRPPYTPPSTLLPQGTCATCWCWRGKR
jgi:hypothetical protein